MEKISSKIFKRNPELIKSYFRKVKDVTYTSANLRIIFSERFITKEFVFMGSTIRTISIFAIVDDNNNYAISIAPIFVDLSPYNVSDVMINDVLNKVLYFNKDDIVIVNNTLVKTDSFIYDLFDEFYVKGNIPWFMGYEDVSDILLEAKKYAGSNVGENALTFEILASLVSRNKKNKFEFIRRSITSEKDVPDLNIEFIGLNNIYYSFDSTGARLFGGYYGSGVTTSMADPEKETTIMMDLIRS